MNHVAITTTCPRCASVVVGEPDAVSGTVECGACGTRFDPRQAATATGGGSTGEAWQPRAGERVGGYVLERELGRGGMSAVWQARQDSLARPVALKFLHAHLASDDELRRRFAREAEAMVQLDHPHIVPVIDRGEHRARPYLVMGLVGARTLRDELGGESGGRRLDPGRVAVIADEALDALAHAHARGLVHRDIKPDNLLIDDHGAIRVADFGIAQVGRDLDGHTLTQLTGTRVVMGTVAYMAPEQSEATRMVDHRCDLYSVGVICYEALRGHRPVGRFEDPADGLDLPPARAAAWNRVVLALLERDPARRPADADAARGLLAACSEVDAAVEPERMEPDEIPRMGGVCDDAAAAVAAAMATARAAVDQAGRHAGEAFDRSRRKADAATAAMNRPPPPSGCPHGRRLLRPRDDRWIAGVCGGLGAWLGVNPDWLRLGAMLGAVLGAYGVPAWLAGYVLAVILIPACGEAAYRPLPLNRSWPQRGEGWFLGVCDLLGRSTTLPPGLWRLAAVLTLPFGSWIAYLVIGIAFPRDAARCEHERGLPAAGASAPPPPDPAGEPSLVGAHRGRAFRFWGLFAVTTAGAALCSQQVSGLAAADTLLWWSAGAGVLAALLASPRTGGRPRAGSFGGILGGLALAGLVLIAGAAAGTEVAAAASLGALAFGAVLLIATACRRYAATLFGTALAIGVGGAALLGTVDLPALPAGLAWLQQPRHLYPLVGIVLAAASYGLLRPLLPREEAEGFQLAPTVVGLAALGAIGIALVPLLPPAGFAGLAPSDPVPLMILALVGALIAAGGRHFALRLILGLVLAAAVLVMVFA